MKLAMSTRENFLNRILAASLCGIYVYNISEGRNDYINPEYTYITGWTVVILTTSKDERDVLAMYELRCSAYVAKPINFDRFQEILQTLSSFWFSVVVLPPKK